MKKSRVQVVAIGIGVAIAVYVALVLLAGWDEIRRGLALLDLTDWALLCSLTLLHFALRYVRWRAYSVELGHRIPIPRDATIYLSGFALTTTPGKVGETWRAIYLKPFGMSYGEVVALFFAERYTDLLAIIVLSMLAAGLYQGPLWPIMAGCLVILVGLLTLRHPGLATRISAVAGRSGARSVQKLCTGFIGVLKTAACLLTTRWIAFGTGVGLLAWGAQGVLLYAVLLMIDTPYPLWTAVGIYAIGLLVGAISFLPGGLGSTEATIVLMLVASGTDAAVAASATLICRVATLWLAVAVGILAAAWLSLSGARRDQSAVETH